MHQNIEIVLMKTQSRAFRTSDGQKVTLNMEWLLVPEGLVWVFQKLLIYWDFHTQPSLGFTENGPKKRKYPVSGSCVDENALLMSEVRGEWADWLEMKESAAGGVMVWGIFSWHTLGPLSTNWASFKRHSLPEYYCWPCPSLYDYSVLIFWWLLPAG